MYIKRYLILCTNTKNVEYAFADITCIGNVSARDWLIFDMGYANIESTHSNCQVFD